jgi:hypothetical protein
MDLVLCLQRPLGNISVLHAPTLPRSSAPSCGSQVIRSDCLKDGGVRVAPQHGTCTAGLDVFVGTR